MSAPTQPDQVGDADVVHTRRDYSTAERKQLAAKGQARPDLSFPIVDRQDLEDAIRSIGRANDPAAAKAWVKKRAAALGLSNLIPEQWRSAPIDDATEYRSLHWDGQITEVRTPDGADAAGDGSFTFTGYAAVFGREAILGDSGPFRRTEVIEPGAFRDVLATQPDVHLLIGHNPDYPLARTGVRGMGALELREDSHGLRVWAKLDPEVSYIRDLARQMKNGVVDQMSFAFTVPPGGRTLEQRTLPDGRGEDLVRIHRVKRLGDVTVTPAGAYKDTSAAIRSLEPIIARRIPNWEMGEQFTVAPALAGGEETVAPSEGGQRRVAERDAMRAQARLVAHRYRPIKE